MGNNADEAFQAKVENENNRIQRSMGRLNQNIDVQKDQLKAAMDNRAAITNPYANMTNQFANLGVATKAAEFQAEEADMALASTLDTMRATGAGAGS